MTTKQPARPTRFLRHALLTAAALSALAVAGVPEIALAARPTSEKSLSHYQSAQSYMDKRDWRTAIIELKNALKADPNNVDARILLGQAYVNMRHGQAAEKEFNAAIERGANPQEVLLLLADSYLLQRKFQDVLDTVKLREIPEDKRYEAQLAIATAYLGLRQTEEALAAYRTAEEMRPKDAGAKIGISRIHLMEREFDLANAKIDEALDLNPQNVEALLIKGELARLSGDFKAAFAQFDAAVSLDPTGLPAVLGRVSALVELNRMEEAARDLDTIFKEVPNHPTARYLAARVAWQNKDVAKAAEHLQATGTALDNFPPAVFLTGLVNFSQNNLEQAAYHLSRLLEMAPTHNQARRILAMTYLRQGNPQLAISTLEPAVNVAEPDAQLYSVLGYAYMQAGDLDRGSEFFDRAVELDPETSGNWTRLAVSKIALGDLEAAEGDLEKVLEKDPNALQPAIILTMVHIRSGEFDQALKRATELGKHYPDNPVGPYLVGEVYLKQGKHDQARKAFEAAQALKADNFAPTLKLAQVDISEGKIDQAEQRYQSILAKKKNHVAAMTGMADVAARRDQPQNVIRWLERAVDAEPRNINLRMRLVSRYMESNELEKAEALASRVTQDFSEQPVGYEALGRIQMARGNTTAALASFERVIALRPDAGKAHHLMAQAELNTNRVVDARESLLTALNLAPDAGDYERDRNDLGTAAAVLLQLSELEAKEKNFDAALVHAADLATRYPDSRAGQITRANILLQKGDFADALNIYDTILEAGDGSTVVAINRYRALVGQGNQQEGLAGLEQWLKDNADDLVARNVLASAYITVGRHDQALGHYEKLRQANPADPLILNNMAWLYSEGNDKRARPTAEEAYRLAPQSPEVMDTYAWILVKEGAVDQGLELLKRAAIMRPGSPDIRYHLAVALERKGQRDEARRELQDLLGLGVSFSEEKEARALLDKLSMR